jgi:hypothetical protein
MLLQLGDVRSYGYNMREAFLPGMSAYSIVALYAEQGVVIYKLYLFAPVHGSDDNVIVVVLVRCD